MKSFYHDHILPYLVHHVCVHEKFGDERRKVVPRARGVVVEFGMGSGLNLPFYEASEVVSVTGIDPSAQLAQKAAARMGQADFPVRMLTGSAEKLPLEDASVDSVLSTFTLCTIPDLAAALAEARRVLKPDGALIFCEHGLAEDVSVARWQNRLNPIWKPFAGGCHLNRDIPALIRAAGFEITELDSSYMEDTPGIGGYLYRGLARPG
ncbi:MAG: SAM-dependent methyltransferase [Hyphomicrobiales bacterium]|nr:MAG: SAM-dependent methyltransferase [Hyphomicrobiales bacterium]